MTSDAKLPIQAWILDCCGGCGARLPLTDLGEKPDDGDWCKADDVRGLVAEHRESVHAARVSLAQEIAGVLRARGHWAPDIHAQPSDVISAVGSALEKAEAQRDRLAEVLRTAVELSHSYDSDNVACWDMVWASADDALADIEKENA